MDYIPAKRAQPQVKEIGSLTVLDYATENKTEVSPKKHLALGQNSIEPMRKRIYSLHRLQTIRESLPFKAKTNKTKITANPKKPKLKEIDLEYSV